MLDNLLNIANRYAAGLLKVRDRKEQWIKKHVELRDRLKVIANHLNTNSGYKQGFFIDTLHAFNEDMHGTCPDMPSITFRSGDMPMLLAFHNSMGERKEYMERGFSITFNPTITGQVVVSLHPHQNELTPDQLPSAPLAFIDEPGKLTDEVIDQIISVGMQAAFYSSFTGMADQPAPSEQPQPLELNPSVQRNPIGFKRYETTQHAK